MIEKDLKRKGVQQMDMMKIMETKEKIEEAKRKHQEALQSLTSLYDLLEQYKSDQWSKESFLQKSFGTEEEK